MIFDGVVLELLKFDEIILAADEAVVLDFRGRVHEICHPLLVVRATSSPSIKGVYRRLVDIVLV